MPRLNRTESQELLRRTEAGQALPESWRERLFPGRGRATRFGAIDGTPKTGTPRSPGLITFPTARPGAHA